MWSIQIRSVINDLAFSTYPAATQHPTCCQAFAPKTQAHSNHTGTVLIMNFIDQHYERVLSSVTNADGLANEVGQLRGEIYKLCLMLAEFDYQPPDDPDFVYYITDHDIDGTNYTITLASNDDNAWFLWDVQVNGSNIFDVLSDDAKELFESIAYSRVMIGDDDEI